MTGATTMPAKSIEEVLEDQSRKWLSLPGVVGTALGLTDGIPCIKVYVVKRGPELDGLIPPVVEGYRVVQEETGEITPLPGIER